MYSLSPLGTPEARTRRVDSIGGVVLGMRNTLYNIDEAVRRSKVMSESVPEGLADETYEQSRSVHHQNAHNKSCTDSKREMGVRKKC